MNHIVHMHNFLMRMRIKCYSRFSAYNLSKETFKVDVLIHCCCRVGGSTDDLGPACGGK